MIDREETEYYEDLLTKPDMKGVGRHSLVVLKRSTKKAKESDGERNYAKRLKRKGRKKMDR